MYQTGQYKDKSSQKDKTATRTADPRPLHSQLEMQNLSPKLLNVLGLTSFSITTRLQAGLPTTEVEKQRQSFDSANKKQITPLKQIKVQLQGSGKSPSARFLGLITKVKQLINSLSSATTKLIRGTTPGARKMGKLLRESTFWGLPQLGSLGAGRELGD